MKNCDYYCTLGIDRIASDAEIKMAYRRLARRLHPDVTDDADGESKFKTVGEAYKTLRHHDSRSAYNQQLSGSQAPAPSAWQPWLAIPSDLWFALYPWPIFTWLWQR